MCADFECDAWTGTWGPVWHYLVDGTQRLNEYRDNLVVC